MTKMKGKPNIDAFLDGAEKAPKPRTVDKRQKGSAVPFRQKGVRLPVPVINALRRRALAESEEQGRRVTEQDIIIAALTSYLGNELST